MKTEQSFEQKVAKMAELKKQLKELNNLTADEKKLQAEIKEKAKKTNHNYGSFHVISTAEKSISREEIIKSLIELNPETPEIKITKASNLVMRVLDHIISIQDETGKKFQKDEDGNYSTK